MLKIYRAKVRIIQQILPACQHPDSSRAYLGLRTRPDERYVQIPKTPANRVVSASGSRLDQHSSRALAQGVELIKPRVNYSLGKFLVV